MKFIATFFFFQGFSAKQQKRNQYSVIDQNALRDNYMENII